MPQTGDQIEQSSPPRYSDVTESNDRLLKPLSKQKSLHQKNDAPSKKGNVTCGVGRVHSNGLVITVNGGVQSHVKSHSNGYVCGL